MERYSKQLNEGQWAEYQNQLKDWGKELENNEEWKAYAEKWKHEYSDQWKEYAVITSYSIHYTKLYDWLRHISGASVKKMCNAETGNHGTHAIDRPS